jgi:YtoQ family protein
VAFHVEHGDRPGADVGVRATRELEVRVTTSNSAVSCRSRRAAIAPDLDQRLYALAMSWQIYLSGEIHTDWREQIERGTAAAGLDLRFTAPVTDHAASDAAGTAILGQQESPFWNDHLGAGVNAIRTRTLIERADVVVVRFGEQYRQWNAAFDAGYAAALGKPLITLHPTEHDHALKEVDRAALAVAREPEQVVGILRYVLAGLAS